MKSASSFREDECVDFLSTATIEISRYGDALSCKKEAHLLLSKAMEIWRKRRSCHLLCSWRASNERT